ncbi:MAG: acyl-CoA thioesterase [Rhodobacter sp.]|nr:acyl-CoA thioesterase [Rhodobacter sp.]
MYPFVRMIKEFVVHRNAPQLALTDTHVSRHVCWPWDIDLWLELNNGRSLTLYDLGRIPLAGRVGLIRTLRRERWSLTMAGVSVRWRHRVSPFERVEMHSRCVGWDHRFVYLEQSMWKRDGRCASQALYRSAVTDRNGIVDPQRVIEALGHDQPSPPLPGWVGAWIEADATRPWPPAKAAA